MRQLIAGRERPLWSKWIAYPKVRRWPEVAAQVVAGTGHVARSTANIQAHWTSIRNGLGAIILKSRMRDNRANAVGVAFGVSLPGGQRTPPFRGVLMASNMPTNPSGGFAFSHSQRLMPMKNERRIHPASVCDVCMTYPQTSPMQISR